jgi:hypothetical protein
MVLIRPVTRIGNSGERERRDTGVGLLYALTTYSPHQNIPSMNFATRWYPPLPHRTGAMGQRVS